MTLAALRARVVDAFMVPLGMALDWVLDRTWGTCRLCGERVRLGDAEEHAALCEDGVRCQP